MKRTIVLSLLVAVVLGLSPTPASAQHTGLRIGVAQPQFVPAHPLVPRSTFAATPFIFQPVLQPIPPIPLVPNFPTVIVPTPGVFPGQPIFAPTIVNPGFPFVGVGQQVFPGQVFPGQLFPGQVFPGQVMNPPVFTPSAVIQSGVPLVPQAGFGPPLIGTPRAEVLRRFGQPSVTVVTSTGETLHFSGGVTVIIQNGQVVGPK